MGVVLPPDDDLPVVDLGISEPSEPETTDKAEQNALYPLLSAFLWLMVRMRHGGLNKHEMEVLNRIVGLMKAQNATRESLQDTIHALEKPDVNNEPWFHELRSKVLKQDITDYHAIMSQYSWRKSWLVTICVGKTANNAQIAESCQSLITHLLGDDLATLFASPSKQFGVLRVTRTPQNSHEHLILDPDKLFTQTAGLLGFCSYTQRQTDALPYCLLHLAYYLYFAHRGTEQQAVAVIPSLDETLEDPTATMQELAQKSGVNIPEQTTDQLAMQDWINGKKPELIVEEVAEEDLPSPPTFLQKIESGFAKVATGFDDALTKTGSSIESYSEKKTEGLLTKKVSIEDMFIATKRIFGVFSRKPKVSKDVAGTGIVDTAEEPVVQVVPEEEVELLPGGEEVLERTPLCVYTRQPSYLTAVRRFD
ncbi:hypothetical protein ACFBZI_11475 [Moraxella sp. ZJ142]|uniref:hypothetical protein n=1 Tax=Moraxella marmotae TaxID=3344520 RepID=UPI0035D4D010